MPDIRWENNIQGFIPNEDWLNVGFAVTRQNDPVDMVFGDEKTDNLVARWESIASQYQIPMMAQFHGFDTESQKTFRVPVDHRNIEKGLIKVKLNQSERLRALTRTGVQGDTALYDYVMNDGIRLADQVFTRSKVAKNELLATGKVTIKENDLDLTVDYGVPSAQTSLTLDFGNSAAKDIPSQLQDIIDAALAVGVTITGMYCGKAVLTKLRQNLAIQTAVSGNIGAGALLSNVALQGYLSDEFGINQILTNDLTYGASATFGADGRPIIDTKRYYPADKVTFFGTVAGARLGTGLWGDPPEVDAGRFFDVSTAGSVSPYVYVMQWMETDPTVLWTKASGLFMPVLFNPNSLFIATVTETTGA